MNWFNLFRERRTVELDADAYKEMLTDSQGLRDDKKRLQVEVDTLRELTRSLADENKKLMAMKVHQAALTPELIAKQLHIPLELVNQIDFERLGLQIEPEKTQSWSMMRR